VASYLNKKSFGTLLFDLLTEEEDFDYSNRFNIDLLTSRLITTTRWIEEHEISKGYSIGYFGASTGAASALLAAASLPQIGAVVSRGGRPDLAIKMLPLVKAPTLLIVGGLDTEVIQLNRQAYNKLTCIKKLEIVPDATHLFEEHGKMDEVSEFAGEWFEKYLHHVEV
jgi:dienelactone hydrolase